MHKLKTKLGINVNVLLILYDYIHLCGRLRKLYLKTNDLLKIRHFVGPSSNLAVLVCCVRSLCLLCELAVFVQCWLDCHVCWDEWRGKHPIHNNNHKLN